MKPEWLPKNIGDKYRLLQAAALLKAFRCAEGRPASTLDEMREWVGSRGLEQPIDPFAILSEQEIVEVVTHE